MSAFSSGFWKLDVKLVWHLMLQERVFLPSQTCKIAKWHKTFKMSGFSFDQECVYQIRLLVMTVRVYFTLSNYNSDCSWIVKFLINLSRNESNSNFHNKWAWLEWKQNMENRQASLILFSKLSPSLSHLKQGHFFVARTLFCRDPLQW